MTLMSGILESRLAGLGRDADFKYWVGGDVISKNMETLEISALLSMEDLLDTLLYHRPEIALMS